MHKKVKDGVGYQLTAEGTRPEVLPPLSWRSPESSGYFYISDFQQGCTVHTSAPVSSKKYNKSRAIWKHENGKEKSGIEKEPAAGWSFSGGSLQSSCPGFAAVDFGYSAPSRPAGQQTRVIKFFLRSLIIILRRIVNVKNLFWLEHQRQPVDVDRVRDNVIVLACKRPLVEHRHKVQQEES